MTLDSTAALQIARLIESQRLGLQLAHASTGDLAMSSTRPTQLQPLAVSPQQAAQLCGCSRQHIYNLIGRGELRAAKLGGLTRIRVADLEALLDRGEL